MSKVILVLSDALGYAVATSHMGFLGHLVESQRASLYQVTGELPSMSRPMYESIHTGLPAWQHGILNNRVVRRSNQPNIFQAAVQAGLTTGAVAYSWFSELYNRAPYDRIEDREVDDPALLIQHGRFYTEDDFPDMETFAAAALLVRRHAPDYLLVHPMGLDFIGEKLGSESKEYRAQAVIQDAILSAAVPEWLAGGHDILVTGDHGIDANGIHGGQSPPMRIVPLFLIRPGQPGQGDTGLSLSQLQIAPTICRLLGVPIPETMRHPPFV